jgi:hypothetical protein
MEDNSFLNHIRSMPYLTAQRFLRTIFCFLTLHVFSLSVFAQDTSTFSPAADSSRIKTIREYIKPMGEYITLKLTQTTDAEAFTVTTPSLHYDVIPNTSSSTRFSFAYRFISFGFGFAPKFWPGNGDEDIQGKTKTGGFGFGFNSHHWQQEIGFSKVKGYYLGNTKDFDPNWKDGDPFVQFPKLQYLGFYGRTGYKFNERFSVNAVVSQSERQLKSAGTFIPAISYRYYIIDNRDTSQGAQKSRNFEGLLHVGYYYNFVISQKFYIALGLTPGFGYVFTNFYTKSNPELKTKQRNPIFSIDGRLGLGYNGERVTAGFYTTLTAAANEQENTAVYNGDTRVHYQLFFAYRLPAPGFLKKWVDWGVEEGKSMIPLKKNK